MIEFFALGWIPVAGEGWYAPPADEPAKDPIERIPPWSDLGRKLFAVHMADEIDPPRKWWAALSGGAG